MVGKYVKYKDCSDWMRLLGKKLSSNFAELGALAAVCDVNLELAQAAAKQYGVEIYSKLEQVLHSAVDGVVIAAPAAQHFDLAQSCLKAGKHVFVEKPALLKNRGSARAV